MNTINILTYAFHFAVLVVVIVGIVMAVLLLFFLSISCIFITCHIIREIKEFFSD